MKWNNSSTIPFEGSSTGGAKKKPKFPHTNSTEANFTSAYNFQTLNFNWRMLPNTQRYSDTIGTDDITDCALLEETPRDESYNFFFEYFLTSRLFRRILQRINGLNPNKRGITTPEIRYSLGLICYSIAYPIKATATGSTIRASLIYNMEMNTHLKGVQHLSVERLKYIHSHFILTLDEVPKVFELFLKLMKTLGKYVSFDEKLFYQKIKTKNWMYVKCKPTKTGLWFFQITIYLDYHHPFVIASCLRKLDGTHDTIPKMLQILIPIFTKFQRATSIVLFDGHYTSADGLELLDKKKINYMISVPQGKISTMTQRGIPNNIFKKAAVTKVHPAYADNQDHVLYCADLIKNGKPVLKFGLTNAFQPADETSQNTLSQTDLFSQYKKNFSYSDQFNRRSHIVKSTLFNYRHDVKNKDQIENQTCTAYTLRCLMENAYAYFCCRNKLSVKYFSHDKFFFNAAISLLGGTLKDYNIPRRQRQTRDEIMKKKK